MELKNLSEPIMLPLPKEDYVTISLDLFINLVKAQQKIEMLFDLVSIDKAFLIDDVVVGWMKEKEGTQDGEQCYQTYNT